MNNNADGAASVLSPRIAEALLVGVAIVWGTSYGVAKSALAYYPVLAFLGIRFGLTFALLLPVWRKKSAEQIATTWRIGAPLGLVLFAIFVCETAGIALTRASNAAFLISLSTVFTPFVEAIGLRSPVHRSSLVAVTVSAMGALLIASDVDTDLNVGDALIVCAAVLRAVMVTATRRLTAGTNVEALALTAVQSGVVASGSLVFVLVNGAPPLPSAPAFWGATLFLVVFCTIFAFFAQNYSAKRLSPTRVSLLMGSEPLFGALFARLWLGDQLGSTAWIGGLLIAGAALWAACSPPPRRR